jgi:hypothetical protein
LQAHSSIPSLPRWDTPVASSANDAAVASASPADFSNVGANGGVATPDGSMVEMQGKYSSTVPEQPTQLSQIGGPAEEEEAPGQDGTNDASKHVRHHGSDYPSDYPATESPSAALTSHALASISRKQAPHNKDESVLKQSQSVYSGPHEAAKQLERRRSSATRAPDTGAGVISPSSVRLYPVYSPRFTAHCIL